MRIATVFFPLLLSARLLFAQFSNDSVFSHPDQMPVFPGCGTFKNDPVAQRRCSDQEMVRFIARHLTYPDSAKSAGIEGTVYVAFVVDEAGAVTQPFVLKDIGGGCGEQALKVLQAMPRWEPGTSEGQKVKVRLNLPIQFSLRQPAPDRSHQFSLTWGNLVGEETTPEALLANLTQPILVRDPQGNDSYLDQLAFTFEKNGKSATATSRGDVAGDLVKIVEKARKGGTFTIAASVQDKGQFVTVSRSFRVIAD